MKIILRESEASLGTVGDVVKVADGYARNYLIPRGMALEATKGNLKQFEAEREALVKKMQKVKGDAEQLASQIEALSLEFTRKSGEEDKLFGSVTNADLTAELKEKGFDIDKRNVVIPEPIKTLGEHKASVKLHGEVTATLSLTVSKEEE